MPDYSFKVEWGDTDAAGIVFYPNYYRWMDNATHEFFETIGYSSVKMFEQDKVGLPILEAHCEFSSPTFFGNLIVITSEIVETWDKVFKIGHTFQRDGITLAHGYETRAWTEFKEDKPRAVSIPEDVREKFQQYQNNGF